MIYLSIEGNFKNTYHNLIILEEKIQKNHLHINHNTVFIFGIDHKKNNTEIYCDYMKDIYLDNSHKVDLTDLIINFLCKISKYFHLNRSYTQFDILRIFMLDLNDINSHKDYINHYYHIINSLRDISSTNLIRDYIQSIHPHIICTEATSIYFRCIPNIQDPHQIKHSEGIYKDIENNILKQNLNHENSHIYIIRKNFIIKSNSNNLNNILYIALNSH
jgi:hypothetical protein